LIGELIDETRLSDLEAILGHSFADRAVLEIALDRTAIGRGGAESHERLEFLGDRVLALVIADRLLATFPKEPEGALARRLAALVSRDSLAAAARAIGLARYLTYVRGEAETGAADNPNVLADAFEAVIAALYRDGGLAAASAFVARHLPVDAAAAAPRDAKSALQEWALARGARLPIYRTVATEGPDHARRFTVTVTVEGNEPATAEGTSKRAAETAAAQALLRRLVPR
jgi:ribonuclease-3